jgi:hypothetical protein
MQVKQNKHDECQLYNILYQVHQLVLYQSVQLISHSNENELKNSFRKQTQFPLLQQDCKQ